MRKRSLAVNIIIVTSLWPLARTFLVGNFIDFGSVVLISIKCGILSALIGRPTV